MSGFTYTQAAGSHFLLGVDGTATDGAPATGGNADNGREAVSTQHEKKKQTSRAKFPKKEF
jgi:hypothetical protein